MLPWHKPTLERLMALAQADALPNAVALVCPPGWGHDSLLTHAALQLLGVGSDRDVEEFAHADFRWVVPEGAVIKIDQIRRVNEFAVQTSQAGSRKIAAVLDAHLLNTNAANALLKTLEEPPPNTHILLATPFWGKLLPTIRSRCQRFQAPADLPAAVNWLADQGVELSEAEFAEYGYAPLAALDTRAEAHTDLTAWLSTLAAVGLEDAVGQVINADLVVWLGRWYRRVLLHLQGTAIPNCSAPAKGLHGFVDDLLSARRQIESSNAANARLLLESLIVRWLQLQRKSAA
jgi:DNA polymerase-3 subunit delta'